jgi:hypothetical protein
LAHPAAFRTAFRSLDPETLKRQCANQGRLMTREAWQPTSDFKLILVRWRVLSTDACSLFPIDDTTLLISQCLGTIQCSPAQVVQRHSRARWSTAPARNLSRSLLPPRPTFNDSNRRCRDSSSCCAPSDPRIRDLPPSHSKIQ